MARDPGRHAAGRGIGPYLLGALDPSERARVAAHVARCAICRREVADLVDLPALLALVRPRDVLEQRRGPAAEAGPESAALPEGRGPADDDLDA